MILARFDVQPTPLEFKCVVRLNTSIWNDNRGIHIKKSITYLRRKSFGHNVLEEDAQMIGAEVIDRITNLGACVDGIYIVDTCNEKRDWESGHIDDYEYILTPYKEES